MIVPGQDRSTALFADWPAHLMLGSDRVRRDTFSIDEFLRYSALPRGSMHGAENLNIWVAST